MKPFILITVMFLAWAAHGQTFILGDTTGMVLTPVQHHIRHGILAFDIDCDGHADISLHRNPVVEIAYPPWYNIQFDYDPAVVSLIREAGWPKFFSPATVLDVSASQPWTNQMFYLLSYGNGGFYSPTSDTGYVVFRKQVDTGFVYAFIDMHSPWFVDHVLTTCGPALVQPDDPRFFVAGDTTGYYVTHTDWSLPATPIAIDIDCDEAPDVTFRVDTIVYPNLSKAVFLTVHYDTSGAIEVAGHGQYLHFLWQGTTFDLDDTWSHTAQTIMGNGLNDPGFRFGHGFRQNSFFLFRKITASDTLYAFVGANTSNGILSGNPVLQVTQIIQDCQSQKVMPSNGEVDWSQIAIHSNPFSDRFNVSNPRQEQFRLNLFTLQGAQVLDTALPASGEVNVPWLGDGLYILQLTRNGDRKAWLVQKR